MKIFTEQHLLSEKHIDGGAICKHYRLDLQKKYYRAEYISETIRFKSGCP